MTVSGKSSISSSSSQTLVSKPSALVPAFLQHTDWKSVYFAALICAMDALRISCIMGGSWPYLSSIDPDADETFFGIGMSVFHVGQIASSISAGWLSNRISHTKPPILFGQLLATLSCFLYVNMEMFPSNRRFVFLVVQLLFGMSSGCLLLWRVCIAMSSTDRDRPRAASLTGFAFNLGFLLGPVFIIPIGYLFPSPVYLSSWGAQFSVFTVPVYLVAFISSGGFFLLLFCFDGRMRQFRHHKEEEVEKIENNEKENGGGKWAQKISKEIAESGSLELAVPRARGNSTSRGCSSAGPKIPLPPSPSKGSKPLPSTLSGGASGGGRPDCAAILACFVTKSCFSAFILYITTLGSAYPLTVFGWTAEQSVFYQSLAQGTMGVMGIIYNLAIYALPIMSRIRERFCVLLALTLMFSFFTLSFPWPFLTAKLPEPTFYYADNVDSQQSDANSNGTIVSSGTHKILTYGCDRQKLTWCDSTPAVNIFVYLAALITGLGLAMPVGQLNLDVLYSRLLGPIKQGTMQGLFAATGETFSLVGPIIITTVYISNGPRPIFLAEICLSALTILLWLFCYRRLLPSSNFYRTPVTVCSKGSTKKCVENGASDAGLLPNGSAQTSPKRELLHSD